MNNTNLLQFAIQKDMRPIYRGLYKKFPNGFPEIFVVNEFPDDTTICKRSFPDGRYALFVRDDDDDTLISRLVNEIEEDTCSEISIPMTYTVLSNEEVAQWLVYACYIDDILSVPLKQIMFAHGEDGAGYSDEFLTFINDDVSVPEMLMVIAHELRHAWQHIHHPDWLDEYIHPENDEYAYKNQYAEIDAEAFGIKIESMITGIEFVNSYAGMELDPKYRSQIINRMNEIDIVLSKKNIKKIRNLIKLEELLQSVKNDANDDSDCYDNGCSAFDNYEEDE